MNILKRKILGPVTLLHLMAVSASIAAVSGATMLYYTWTIDLTLAQTDLTFYRWSDGATAGTITLTYNYYIDVVTLDRNATWGIWNRGVSNKTAYLWADSPFFPYEINNFFVGIVDESGVGITSWSTSDWSTVGEDYAVSWNAIAGAKYTLMIYFQGSSTATFTEEIVLRLKTDP